MPTQITSPQNQRIKNLAKLNKRRVRDAERLTLVEGVRECTRALRQGVIPREAYLCPDLLRGQEEEGLTQTLEEMAARGQLRLFYVTPEVFGRLAYRVASGGAILVIAYLDTALKRLSPASNAFYAVVEGIEKPGNLGAILRTADAAGVDGVIVCRTPEMAATDLHNPNVVRASLGALFSVPLAEASTRETVAWLKEQRIKIIAATPTASRLYTQMDLTGPVAVVLGSEATGLSAAWLAAADTEVTIPMQGIVDSLNLATSTALLLYEVVRQRSSNESRKR